MNNVTIKTITPLKNPKFIIPVRINYIQNNKEKTWEAIKTHNSVATLLYHKEKDAFLLVKQLRIATCMDDVTCNNGFTYELCAGIVDKPLSLKEIAQEEILEECGYKVDVNSLKKITSFYTSVGFSGAHQTMYFAEIDESMKISQGGGIEEEEIELFYLQVCNAKKFMFDESYKKTPGLIMAFYWYFDTYKKEF
jgi:UDP-sugar diphosphatase